jgi:tetratricopeptide (TPR) repeat protein
VPPLLERIAACHQRPLPPADDVIDGAVAREPLLADIARDAATRQSESATHRIYDLAVAAQKLAHQHSEDRDLALRYLRPALELATAIGHVHHMANLHADIGWMHVTAGDFDEALPLLRTAADMSHSIGDTDSEILHVGNLGFGLARSGDENDGFAVLDRATTLARDAGKRERLLWLLRQQGFWYKERRDSRALPFLEEAIVLAEEMGDLSLAADLSFDAGKVYRDTGQFEPALEYRLRGVRILDALGKPSPERLVVVASLLENNLARPADAVPFYERGLALCAQDPSLGPQVLEMLYRALSKRPPGTTLPTPVLDALASRYTSEQQAGLIVSVWAQSVGFESLAADPVIASRVLTYGKSISRAIGEAVLAYARSLMQSGQLPSAHAELQEAERIATSIGDREWLATVRRSQGDLLRAEGKQPEALQRYADAERIAALTGNAAETELLCYAMADITFEQGALDVALSHIERALAAARENQYAVGIAHDLLKLADILTARSDLDRAERSLAEAIPIFHDQSIVSQWIESTVKRADLLVQLGRPNQALDAYRSIEPAIQRGGSAMARRRFQEGIERALCSAESVGNAPQ